MSLAGKKIAVLIEDEFEDRELTEPVALLRQDEATVVLVGGSTETVYRGKRGTAEVRADTTADKVRASELDAIVIPGGHAPEKMRMRPAMVDLVRDVHAAGKPVAAICHGPQLLISANVLRGRTLTCWPSIAVDVINAGGLYVDRPVVVDGNLITSRKPDDIPHFTEALLRTLAHEPAKAFR